MKHYATHYLALLAVLFYCLLPAPARAQVLRGTAAAGVAHSLSIHADGTLWATGDNSSGELGDGTTLERATWVQVGTATNWVQVAAGEFFSLGLRTDGTLWAWGWNYYGQLGTLTNSGTHTPNPVPVQVPGTYTQVAASWQHSLALRADGTLWAWGNNQYGQLGSASPPGTNPANPVPTQVAGLYAQVAAGSDYSLALRADGSLYAWGNNRYGQLGTATGVGTNTANPEPSQVAGTYTRVAAGAAHALALRADGSLWAWGDNGVGQLGTPTNSGTNTANPVPTQVAGTYTSASAGNSHSLALRADGSLWAWGSNQYGQLGSSLATGTSTPNPVPTALAGTYVQAVAGFQHSLGLRANGTLWTWGSNSHGELGSPTNQGTPAANPTPTATGTALPTRSTAMGNFSGLAIRGDGSLWAWGSNQYGQLGDGTSLLKRLRPVRIGTDNDWVQVVAAESGTLALKANGQLYAWGQNTGGHLGVGSVGSVLSPTLVMGGQLFKEVAAGAQHSLALAATGQLYAWGLNTSSQLGLGITADSNTPTEVSSGLRFVHVAAGSNFSLALAATGQLYAWGNNQFGQLGSTVATGPTTTGTPTLVAGLPVLAQVVAGDSHSLVRTATGTAYAWGYNYFGQLSGSANLLTTIANPTPRLVPGTPALTQVAAGRFHSLALTAAGTIYTWGSNIGGELGLGPISATGNPVPAQEVTLNGDWATLGTGCEADMSLVRTASAQSFASAGPNNNGELGDGTMTGSLRFDRLSPLASLQPLPVLAAAGGVAFSLAPNPASSQATAVGVPAGTTLAVYDALGRLVITTSSLTFSVGGLPAGVYLVRATAPGQAPQSARLLVE